jgi:hypothetical protein
MSNRILLILKNDGAFFFFKIMSSPLIWFMLVDSNGVPYKGLDPTVSSILKSSLAMSVIDQFRKAVNAEHSNKHSSVDAADLLVFKNKAVFDNRNATVDEGMEESLEEDSFIYGYRASKKEAQRG